MWSKTNKLSITCPLFTNDGRPLDSIIDRIREEMASVTGGVSQFLQRGVWFNGLDKYDEPSIVLYTVCEDNILDELTNKLAEWCTELEQIELLATVEPVNVAFITAKVKTI